MNTDLNGKIQGKLNQNRKNRNTKKVLLVLSLAAVIFTSTVLANPASALTEDVSGEVVQGMENGGDSGSGAQAPVQAAVEQADAQGNEAAPSSDPQETVAAPSADQGVMNANSVSAVDSAAVTENGTGDSGIAVSGAEADGTKKSADQISAADGNGTAEQDATLAEAAETVSTEEAAAEKTTEKTEQAAQSETDVLSFADDRAQMKVTRKDGTGFPSDTTMSGSSLGTDDWNRVLSAVSSKVKAQSDDSTAYSVAGLHTWTLSLQAGDGSAASYDDIRAEAEFQGGLNDAGYATKTSEKEENGTDGTSTTTASYKTSWRVYAISGDSIADPVEDQLTDLTDADGTSLSVDENGALQSAAFDGNLPETVVFAQIVRETVTTGTEKKKEIPMPAVTFDKEAATDHGTITVHVEADEGTFEQGTTMSVKQVSSQDILDKAIEAAGGRGSAAAVDISFRKADGTETEPAKPIRVKMTAKVLSQADKVHVVHVDDTGSTDVVARKSDGKTIESTSSEAASSDAKNTVSFESDSFSVYAIVYTVDFHWEVDGQMYEFSLPRGGFISFSDLIEVLGVAKTGENDDVYLPGEVPGINDQDATGENGSAALTLDGVVVSEKTREFVADVKSVVFSSPELVDVSKVESETTVGGIKESRGLDVQYSAELTEEQIAEINAQTVVAGDWALISVQPFESTESLTVTMKTGEVFEIRVTDAQLKKTVKTASGETWEITITYDDSAEIPKDAELRVEEILPEDERYEQYYQQSLEKISVGEVPDTIEDESGSEMIDETAETASEEAATTTSYAHIFDIQIWAGDQQIEPASGSTVSVSIKLLDAPENEDTNLQVVHFGKDGLEVMELAENNDETKAGGTELNFVTDEFSVYAIVGTEAITIEHIDHKGTKYEVTVSYGPDAKIPEGSTLSVTDIEKDTEEYETARNSVLADKKEKGEYIDIEDFNFAALDISIIDPDGNEIEPEATVQVDIKIKSLPDVEDLDKIKDTLEIQHHVEMNDGSVIIETVSDSSNVVSFKQKTNEDVIAEDASRAVDPESIDLSNLGGDDGAFTEENTSSQESISLHFDVEVFSTYSITWTGGSRSRTANVHYGYMNGNTFVEFPNGTPSPSYDRNTGYAALIYDVDGYHYSYTYRGTNTTQNRIIPLLRYSDNRWQYSTDTNIEHYTWGYDSTMTWTNIDNNNNIYVVYEKDSDPTQGGTVELDDDEKWPEGNDAPQFSKSSTNNGNGTNTISLSIEAAEKEIEDSTKANVIVVFDISGSMDEDLNGQTRLDRAKTAVNNMADILLNKTDGQGKKLVKMGLVSFSTTATEVVSLADTAATNATTYKQRVNALTQGGGTNWEQALYLANRMAVDSDAATFIVFVTDGDPTFRVSRGNYTDAQLDMFNNAGYQYNTAYSYWYPYYRSNAVFGNGYGTLSENNNQRNFDAALVEAKSIIQSNKNFYAIGVSEAVTAVQSLVTQAGGNASNAYLATDSQALTNAFNSIVESINATLGFGNVEITDGITALTNAEMKVMQTVDPNSFKYYRYGGENNKYGNGYANKTEWTTREADGCAAASYSSADGAVHWDMGENFQLEDDVTYVVEFTVWPSQAAYDLVADLNNGLKTYASLTNEEKAQVVELTAPTQTTTGTYALKTNTNQVKATYSQTTKSGDVVSVTGDTDITADYHQGTLQNMSLDSDYITVKKEWHNALDGRVVKGITLTVTKDNSVYLDDLTLNESNSWTSDEQYISAGVITKTSDGRYNVRETGHEYTVTEPASFSYYWDLTADVYRPMVIDGTLTMLIKTDSPTGTEGTDYYVIGGKKYQVSTTTTPQLVASNDRRSNLNLKKIVTANTQAVDNVPDPDDVFTYTITVTDANGDAVWFSAQDEEGNTVSIDSYSANVTPELDADENPTGSYSVPSGAQFTISIKAGWNVRFFNLPRGTTYSIQETGMEDGYEFVEAETSAEVTKPKYADDFQATPGTVSGDTVTGTIDQPNNVYSTEYTNNWNPDNEIVIIKTDENGTKLAGAQFKLYKMADDWTEIAAFTSNATAGETLKVGHGLYKLEETTAPTNYIMTDTVYFKVETSGNTTTVTLVNEDGEEIDGEDLPVVYPDATASNNEVTVKNWPLTKAEANKAWKNADGTTTAPTGASVVYTLYIDGEASDYTVTLDGTDDTAPTGTDPAGYEIEGWKAAFVNLDKYKLVDGEAVEIVYTIAETTTYPGYTASTTAPVANGGTITNTQEATTANALKAWKNADGSTTAPEGATVVYTLYADGTATNYTVTLDGIVDTATTGTSGYESEAWKAMFVNLPKYQTGTTTEIVYTIAETTTYPGYTPSTTDPVASGETITNEQGSTDTYAEKVWKNADGSDTAPEGATVVFTLYADGAATSHTVTLDGEVDTTVPAGTGGYESAAWTATFLHLLKYQPGTANEIVYTIAETTTYPGYTPSTTEPVGSGSKITNSQDPTSANALKAWVNADGTTSAPQGGQVTYTLYADGEATEYAVTLDGTVDSVPEVTGGYESEAWKAEFVNLPKYKIVNGAAVEIEYKIAETTTYPGYTASTTDPVASGETITNTQEKTDANAIKAWKNADGTTTPPAGATVEFTLYADGDATEYKVTLDGTPEETVPTAIAGYESEAWKATFVNLPKYKVVEGEEEGETEAVEIVYTVGESHGYAGYTADKTEPVASGETITNAQDDIDVYATKAWLNADGTDTAPEGATVVFTLFADGTATEHTVTLDGTVDEEVPEATGGYESEAWKATFVNLPKYQADGTTEIEYTIAETTGYETYEMIPETDVASGGVITNKQITTVIQIKKIGDWTVGKTLSGVQFKLFSDEACEHQIMSDSTGVPFGTDGIITTGSDGTITIGALIPGTYYLQEVKTADGYNLLDEVVAFTIKADGTIEYSTGNTTFEVQNRGAFYELEDGGYGIYINNPSGAALPRTGGPGTILYTLSGLALILASAMMYGFRMRRRVRRLN